MIKNIPNKYTIQDLSNEINQSFSNSYDFLYLPCDIKVTILYTQNNCNVGYGFINFLNTEILAIFYQKFHNKKWIKFRSDKVWLFVNRRSVYSPMQDFKACPVSFNIFKTPRFSITRIKGTNRSSKIFDNVKKSKPSYNNKRTSNQLTDFNRFSLNFYGYI